MRSEPQTVSMSRKANLKRWLIVLSAGAAVAAVVLLLTRPDPQAIYLRALESADDDVEAAESQAARAIAAAGGDFPQAQLLQCRLLGEQGRWIEARGGFSLIRDWDVCNADEIAQLAAEALSQQEYSLVEMALPALAERNDYAPTSRRALIDLYLQMGRRQQALVQCEALAQQTPEDAFPWLTAAEIYQGAGKLSRAIDAYQQALQRKPSMPQENEARTQLVELLIQLEDAVAARREFDLLIEQKPPTAALRLKEARLLRLEGKLQEALKLVEEKLRADPEANSALMLRGVLRLDVGQTEQAAADLQRVVESLPTAKEAHYKLAQAYRKLGRSQEAAKHLQISARLNQLGLQILALQARVDDEPHNRQLLRELADLCDRAGRPQEAARWRNLAAIRQP